MILDEHPEWMTEAACGPLPKEIFFPENLRSGSLRIAVATAFATCAKCPVRSQCLQHAIAEEEFDFGIWGGLDPAERRSAAGIPVPAGRQSGRHLHLRRVTGRNHA